MNDKEKYLQFYKLHPDIPIFSSPWWLDAVCGKNGWDVIIIEKNGEIYATFPYCKKICRFKSLHIIMPPVTQKLGPYFVYEKNMLSENKRISFEHEMYQAIIERLPKYKYFCLNFSQTYKNWLAFYWAGFQQTSFYSYQIKNIKDYESVKKGYTKSKRYEIPKARKNLIIKYDLPADVFFDYFESVIKSRNEIMHYSRDLFYSIYKAVYENNAGRVFYCEDKNGNIHAINLTVWDSKTA